MPQKYEFLSNLIIEYMAAIENSDIDTRDNLADKIKVAGHTAAYLGGFEAMTQLHNDVININNDAGYYLNRLWDGIGGWWR